MPSNDLLGIYLNDHLAGSAAGLELAEKLRDKNQGTEARQHHGGRAPDAQDREAWRS